MPPDPLFSRTMTPAERQRRSRSLRHIREKAAAKAALLGYVRSGLLGTDEEALAEIAELLADLPTQLEAIRTELAELRKAGAAAPR